MYTVFNDMFDQYIFIVNKREILKKEIINRRSQTWQLFLIFYWSFSENLKKLTVYLCTLELVLPYLEERLEPGCKTKRNQVSCRKMELCSSNNSNDHRQTVEQSGTLKKGFWFFRKISRSYELNSTYISEIIVRTDNEDL